MFPGSPFQMVTDNYTAKAQGKSGPLDSLMGFGGSSAKEFGSLIKSRGRPVTETLMGGQTSTSGGASNVFR